jgi:hypothetical protein
VVTAEVVTAEAVSEVAMEVEEKEEEEIEVVKVEGTEVVTAAAGTVAAEKEVAVVVEEKEAEEMEVVKVEVMAAGTVEETEEATVVEKGEMAWVKRLSPQEQERQAKVFWRRYFEPFRSFRAYFRLAMMLVLWFFSQPSLALCQVVPSWLIWLLVSPSLSFAPLILRGRARIAFVQPRSEEIERTVLLDTPGCRCRRRRRHRWSEM